jgi:hypothetical protein
MHNILILCHAAFSAAEIWSNRRIVVLETFRSDKALPHLPDVMTGENDDSPQSVRPISGLKIEPQNANYLW